MDMRKALQKFFCKRNIHNWIFKRNSLGSELKLYECEHCNKKEWR